MKKNSIEEAIKILEEFKTHGYAMLLIKYEDRNKANRKLDQAIEHILSDYKRVLKENEELNREIGKSIDNSKGGLDEEFIEKARELLVQKRILQELLEGRKI